MVSWFDQELARWVIGIIAASLIALAAWRAGALAPSGAAAAIVTGAVLVGGAGWWAGVLLVVFFVSSSALSQTGKRRAGDLLQGRGSRRDAVQVLANGGIAVLCAIGFIVSDDGIWIVALATSLAAANADTWATEIGRLSGQRPRSIVTLRSVPAGTSGGVSFPGTIAAFAGAALIGIVANAGWSNSWLSLPAAESNLAQLLMIVVGCGFAGSLIDSLLGATVQGQFRCPTCDVITESRIHTCGTPTVRVRGLAWITNDVVNIAAVGIAAGLALWLCTRA
ncbi:MAG: DUF92 domain-containing protein [Thermomicrobiales bacterium]